MPAPGVELSIVLPCLDGAEMLGACLPKAQDSVRRLAVAGEVVVAGNVSTGGSQDIARAKDTRANDARARLSLTRISED